MARRMRLLKLSLLVVGLGYGVSWCWEYCSSSTQAPKRAIIIGASSGIGSSLARELAKHGCEVGLTGRRVELLEELSKELKTKSYVQQLDVRMTDQAQQQLASLITTMGDVDLIIINAGVGINDKARDWEVQKSMLETNVLGFAAMAHAALAYFIKRGSGHLVGITSPAGDRGMPHAYSYGATKAFETHLLEGIRNSMRAEHLPITITDIKPGFIETAMIKDSQEKFWVVTPEVAAVDMYDAIARQAITAYVPWRWAPIGWLLRNTPDWLWSLALHFAPNKETTS